MSSALTTTSPRRGPGGIAISSRSARRSADLAQKLYDAGRTSYLDLLDAQRALTTVQRSEAQLRGSRAVTTVALILLVLRAFSSGCTALTGVEAISNGVASFR